MSGRPLNRIDLTDHPYVVTTVVHLRAAWRHIPSSEEQEEAAQTPGADGTCKTVTKFMKINNGKMDMQGRLIRSSSEENVHSSDPRDLEPGTPWRRGVYHMFNHVFWDASRAFEKLGVNTGHLHPPSEGYVTVRYGEDKKMTWAHNTLIMPIFLAHEVSVKGALASSNRNLQNEEEETNLSFHLENPFELWSLRASNSIIFTAVETSLQPRPSGDVAAVLLVGTLCEAGHVEDGESC